MPQVSVKGSIPFAPLPAEQEMVGIATVQFSEDRGIIDWNKSRVIYSHHDVVYIFVVNTRLESAILSAHEEEPCTQ